MNYVILGNGIAGMEAALALRKHDASARITLISAEHEHFFSRTALMYILAGQLALRDTEPYDRDLYDRLRFTRIKARVAALDAGRHLLLLEGGQEVGYDRLLLAVGSRARPAPWKNAEGGGVHYFVTLQDLERLAHDVKPGKRVAVIGGGLIGVETAETLKLRGLKVHFLIREPFYFPVALDGKEAAVVAEHIRHHGVDVRLGTGVDAIVRDAQGRITGVDLGGGGEVIPVDLVVSSIGVVPNTDFLKTSGLALSEMGAIEAGDDLRTNLPDVWTAGDCANVTWVDGARRPEQLWYTARDQGRIAARSMAGEDVTYRRGAWYNSAKFFDIEYTTAGFIPFPLSSHRGAATKGLKYSTWYQQVPGQAITQRIIVKDERVVGFNGLGSRWNHEVWLRWIQQRRPLPWVLEHMNEARFDEEFMPPFRVLPSATLTASE